MSIFKRNRLSVDSNGHARWSRRDGSLVAVPESSSTPVGATFGPWATHETRCKCSVCR